MKCEGLLFISSACFYLVSNVWCTQYPSYKDSFVRKNSVYSNVKEISNDRNEPRTSMAPPLADTILVSLNVDVIGSENRLHPDGPHNGSTKPYLSMDTEELSFVFFVLAIICVTVLPLLMVWIVIMNAIAPSQRKNKIDDAKHGLKIYTIHIV